MQKINVYIDGFNLYHAIVALKDPTLKWINLRALAKSYLGPNETLNRVVYFTAVLTWNKEKQNHHKNYIAAQIASGVEVVESKFRRVSRHCGTMKRNCPRHEEKQTDVAFAITVFSDAMKNSYDRAVIITADSDQVPLVKSIRSTFPQKVITLAAPPERGGEARELGSVVHERRPITPGRLMGCRLPRDVVDAKGKKVATMPAIYLRNSEK